MDGYEKDIIERQIGVNRAFGRMYFAIYSIDLVCDRYLEIATLDIFREHIPPQEKNQHLFDMVVQYYVSDGYKDSMREFLDMDTLQERLREQNAVSNEFFGTTQGWCRASLVVEKRDEAGKVLRFAYVTQEINEEVKTEQERIAELKRSYEAVDMANQAKSDFLFRMSHDIRTPLNAIMGFDHLIARRADEPEKVREYAEKIQVSGNLLLSLLNEILDMTKIESGKAVLNTEQFCLGELIDELDMVIRSQTAQKEQQFIVDRQEDGHDRFVGDKVRLSRILFNILGNAVKYTDNGGKIIFSIQEEAADDEEQATLVFVIRDTGIGMTKELADRVFEKFTRGNADEAAQESGAGLGLPIAKSFTELMGGAITLASEPGKGSAFTVRIPLVIDTTGVRETKKQTPAGKDVLSGLHVLIVEDNEMNMEIITEILEMAHVTCDAAPGGAEAVRRFRESPVGTYDLIIMDVCMPVMDGYETTRRIRSMERADAASVPIIALTANAFEEDVKNAKRAGMNAHLAKPLDMTLLREMVCRLLQK